MNSTSETIVPTVADLETVEDMLKAGTALDNERFENDHYLDDVVENPWGLECRIYADSFYDIWKLSIRPGGRTSLHCHPRKDTALLCLGGQGEITRIEQPPARGARGGVRHHQTRRFPFHPEHRQR